MRVSSVDLLYLLASVLMCIVVRSNVGEDLMLGSIGVRIDLKLDIHHKVSSPCESPRTEL